MKKLALSLLPFVTLTAHAEVNAYGNISIESRNFFKDALYKNNGQKHGSEVSLILEPSFEWHGENSQFIFKPFARLNTQHSDREHVDIREGYYLTQKGDVDIKVGVGKEYWGVMESNHLIDIINQTDLVENPDGEDKLGQPMLRLNWNKNWGNVIAYALPYFRERTYAGQEGRLRGPVAINTDSPIHENGESNRRLDAALRFEKTMGEWDLGVAHFTGTSREPQFIAGVDASFNPTLTPSYGSIDQTSLDIQYTGDEWLLKLEAMTRSGQGNRFGAYSAGFEYTFYDVMELGHDLGTIAEYSQDNRDADAAPTLYNNDLFIGARYTLNDVDDTQILIGSLIDIKSKFRTYSVEASTRLNDHFSTELEGRFAAGNGEGVDVGLNNEDFIQLRLSYYY